uniref:Iron-containing alcohol dehydrogenase n=1 Tax=candidate division CPR3 bacterium TaxID=2268181 RepID=A0A7V3J9I8_UNCC3
MEKCWQFATPKYLRAGEGSGLALFDYLIELEVKKSFVVIDPTLEKTNIYVQKILEKIDAPHKVFNSFSTNPTTEQVNNAVRIYTKFQPDGVIAIGGGSAIDLSKATMLTSLNNGVIEDYLGGKKGTKPFPPFIVLPTTCGTGSEASPYAVITDKKLRKKRGIEDTNFLPTLVIMDPLLLTSLSQTIIAATAIDALAHVTESFISKKANEITRSSSRGLFINLIQNIENASFKKDGKTLGNMLNVAFTSRLLYPRTGLTIAHALSHPLGAHTNIHHGLAVSFFIPVSLEFNYDFCKENMNEALKLMGFTNLKGFNKWFINFCDKSGIKSSIKKELNKINLPIETLAKDAMESSNIPSNPRTVDQKKLEEVIKDSILLWGLYE